jgi:alkyl sulfatase BDS1-like metallo-beta-lactamase superfamily hydrolase
MDSNKRLVVTASFIAATIILHPARSQQTKPAEPNAIDTNRAVQFQLPFGDRQDFEDAMRGFIATTRPGQSGSLGIS